MNKVKNYNPARSFVNVFAVAFFASVLVCVGCSSSNDIAGTSEEPNEIAKEESSSSQGDINIVVVSSSSQDTKDQSSSSSGTNNNFVPEPISSSSSSVVPAMSSSSLRDGGYDRPGGGEPAGTSPNVGLDNYGAFYGVSDISFDSAVVASTVVFNKGRETTENPVGTPDDSSDAMTPGTNDKVTELNSPGLHKMGNRLDALYEVFQESAKNLIELGKKAAAENSSCETYLYNVRGQSGSIGHVLVGVASDTLTVLDIRDEKCQSTDGQVVGFVFIYCGEMNSAPYEKRVYVDRDSNAGKCPVMDPNFEWTN